jgi:hypothetical protein
MMHSNCKSEDRIVLVAPVIDRDNQNFFSVSSVSLW